MLLNANGAYHVLVPPFNKSIIDLLADLELDEPKRMRLFGAEYLVYAIGKTRFAKPIVDGLMMTDGERLALIKKEEREDRKRRDKANKREARRLQREQEEWSRHDWSGGRGRIS